MQYLYAEITVTPFSESTCDILAAMLGEVGFDSFEQTETGLKAYIQQVQFNESSLQETLDSVFVPDVHFSYEIHTMENRDWNAEWEQNHFDPVLEREYGIRLNPRMAFGSGSHDTTYQITSLLLQEDFTHCRVLDMGTGTGVLGIAMSMRGAEEVVAIDIDEFSVENARENFLLNNIHNATVLLGDASSIGGIFNVVVANIHKNILTNDMPTYVEHLAENGQIIISGFFSEDIPDMEKVASENKLFVERIVERNGWAVMMLRKP